MLYYDGTKWQICTEQIRYIEERVEKVKYVTSEGRNWWLGLAQRWDGLEIVEFMPVTPTPEQVERYQDILALNLPDGWGGTLSGYVEFGEFPEGNNHILKSLQDTKKIEELENIIDILLGGEDNE